MRRSIARRSGRGRRRPPAGFTLVELLVVITIIGMLMAMVFPATGQVMEMFKRMQCQQNLKQMATAVTGYAGRFKTLPPGVTVCLPNSKDHYKMGGVGEVNGGARCMGPNWAVLLLNDIGESTRAQYLTPCLESASNVCQCADEERLGNLGGTSIKTFHCPDQDDISQDAYVNTFGLRNLAKGNYAACFGSEYFINVDSESGSKGSKDGAFGLADASSKNPRQPGRAKPSMPKWFKPGSDVNYLGTYKKDDSGGVPLGYSGFPDGDSKTILFSEVLAYLSPADGRGAWSWGGMGGSVFTGKNPPNADGSRRKDGYDRIPVCAENEIHAALAMHCTTNRQDGKVWASARSNHPGLVNCVMADSHTRIATDTIDETVWKALCTRRSGAKREAGLDFSSGE